MQADRAALLTRNWLHFGALLRGLGFDAGPARTLPFLRSLGILPLDRFADLQSAVRAHYGRRRDELPLLDRALVLFLLQSEAAGSPPAVVPKSLVSELELGSTAGRQLSVLDDDTSGAAPVEMVAFSAAETLRRKDFDAMTEDELKDLRRLIRSMRLPAGSRRSRRFRPGGDDRLDLRRLLRSSLRFNGEPLIFSWRRPRIKPRPLVLLCDISGSMERYTRILLTFAYAIGNASSRVEAFVFATRLTRVTHQLRHRDADAALDQVVLAVADWSGGTRIGAAIDTFNRRYARRMLAHGATVVVISDGWDRGDPRELREAVGRLQRSCHRLIWMNPLMGAPGYEPLTLGLQAALPFVDDFLPAHNLASLEGLGRLLLKVRDPRRYTRRRERRPA